MPLGFIKKLASKLLGTEKKTALKKMDGAKKRPEIPTPVKAQGPGRGGVRTQGRDTPPGRSGGRRSEPGAGYPPRKEGGGRPYGGRGEGPRPRRGDESRDAKKEMSMAPAASGARAVARPPSKDRRGHGSDRDRGERPVSNPHARRPGGAATDSEVAKRLAEHAAWSLDQYQVEPEEGKKRFQDFDLPSELLHAVSDLGFKYCSPIQALSLEHALVGKNVAGKAQTGTGKTAAFLVAILTRYLRSPESRQEKGGAPRTLVIAPTRELVIQICKDAGDIGKYCGLRSLAVYGGMDYERQKREVMDAPVDLLVATPGRLLDFVRSHIIDLSKVDTLVIDEADRMLDMGFIPDVRSIINRLPPKEKRCTMLYSATLDETVMRLASQWMEEPVKVEVESEHVTTKTVKQIVYVVRANEKFTVLYNQIQQYPDSRMLIFCNRRNTTEDVADSLSRRGIKCEMLSGDVNQNRRLRVLEDFREGKVRIVVATDVAGRGIHVDDIGFVINFDFPYEPEDYVHRIGRTGRAGHTGTAISFADEDESFIIPDIEKFIGEELKCTVLQSDDPLMAKLPAKPQTRARHERGAEEAEQRPRQTTSSAPAAQNAPGGGASAAADEAVAAAAEGPEATHRPEAPVAPQQRVELPKSEVVAVSPEALRAPAPEPKRHVPTENRSHESAHAVHPAPGLGAGGTKAPRFSEEWIPGQGSK